MNQSFLSSLRRSLRTHFLVRNHSPIRSSCSRPLLVNGDQFCRVPPRIMLQYSKEMNHLLSTAACFRFTSNLSASRPVVPFLLADIGEGITECEITQWFVKEGDVIAQFDKICEVQSDKAAVEISSRFDGIVSKLHYNIGDMAQVGAPLIDIAVNEESDSSVHVEPQPNSTGASSPALSPSTSLMHSSPAAPPSAIDSPSKLSLVVSKPIPDRIIFATPAVRRLAREKGIDLSLVPATGKGDRILKEDVLKFIASGDQAATPASTSTTLFDKNVGKQDPAKIDSKHEDIRPLTSVQKAMFKSMTKSLSIPHFVYTDEVRMDPLISVREAMNQIISAAPKGSYPFYKVSFMPLLIKTFSLALHHYPLLNAQLVIDLNLHTDQAAQSAKLRYRSRHNVSIAMDTPTGLLVPSVKDVQDKSVLDIAAELHRLQEAGKKGALTAADLQGGTITLSNIGAVGGTYMSPVIVTSEVCIAALGKMVAVPRFKDTSLEVIEPHHVMPVSISADHRVVDGATVARFVHLWKQYIESPTTILAAVK